jgi:hypothetical protein
VTWRRAWAAPLSLLLAAGCLAVALVSMPPGCYLLVAAAAAFGAAGLAFAESRP